MPNCIILSSECLTRGAVETCLIAKDYINNDTPLIITNSDQILEWNKEKYINYEELLSLLVTSKLRCYYCKGSIMLLYNNIREPRQWTLDRIDNNHPHNTENVVISCLKCNLERRRRDDKKFLMGKQMKITKKY